MKSFAAVAVFAGAALATSVAPGIAPQATAPAGCMSSYSGSFELAPVKVAGGNAKRTALVVTLSGGILKDAENRYGYIASNRQFQFDNPIQADAIYTGGWSVCSNGSLALGGSTNFYQCLSGGFYNLYDESTAAQCTQVHLQAVSTGGAQQQSDGQVTAASAYTSVATVACQITDGQVQANTCLTTVTYTPPATVISQITDGQIQGQTAVVISQITDGQIQAQPTMPVISQITDGQVQAPKTTANVISQITDGQIQATTPAVISQITDGQVQAPKSSVAVISQISDGQVQASVSATATTTKPAIYTGAAAKAEIFGLAAGLVALAAL